MDKQDAIKCLKSMQQWIPDWDDREDGLSYWDAIDMAIAALSPPNEPLTLEQLRGKVGQPVVIKYSYGGPHTVAIVDVRYVPHLGADKIRLVFADGYITVNERDYGTYFTTYAYPPAHIDREVWMAEWRNHYRSGATAGTGYVCSSCDMWNGRKSHICPSCGKAMDADGLSELEQRLRG